MIGHRCYINLIYRLLELSSIRGFHIYVKELTTSVTRVRAASFSENQRSLLLIFNAVSETFSYAYSRDINIKILKRTQYARDIRENLDERTAEGKKGNDNVNIEFRAYPSVAWIFCSTANTR